MAMNDANNPGRSEHGPTERAPSVGALLRAGADGELGAEDRARLESLLHENPELASCVDFERELRGACARAMGDRSPACPDAVRERIESMRGAPASTDHAERPIALDTHTHTHTHTQARDRSHTRSRSFWQRGGALGAMAAALLLAGGALLWNSASFLSTAPGVGAAPSTRVGYAERIGDFVSGEHKRCLDEQAASAKLVYADLVAVRERYTERFGAPVRLPDRFEPGGPRFFGAGDCNLPSTPKSAHLRFDLTMPGGRDLHMSLFVAPDPGLLALDEGVTYTIRSDESASHGAALFAWSVDGVLYVLVSDARPGSSVCARVRALLNAPEAMASL